MSSKPTSITRKVLNVETELVIQPFSDRIMLLLTQVGKVGNLVRQDNFFAILSIIQLDYATQIQASIPPTAPLLPSTPSLDDVDDISAAQSLPTPPPSIQLISVLGSAPTDRLQTLHSLYASQAATLVWLTLEKRGAERKSVVVGIALKKQDGDGWDEEMERARFREIMAEIKLLLAGWQ